MENNTKIELKKVSSNKIYYPSINNNKLDLKQIPNGRYNLVIRKEGYKTYWKRNINIINGTTEKPLRIILEPVKRIEENKEENNSRTEEEEELIEKIDTRNIRIITKPLKNNITVILYNEKFKQKDITVDGKVEFKDVPLGVYTVEIINEKSSTNHKLTVSTSTKSTRSVTYEI